MMITIVILQSCFSLVIFILLLRSILKNRNLLSEKNRIAEKAAECESLMQKMDEKAALYYQRARDIRALLTLIMNYLADYMNSAHSRTVPALKSMQYHINRLISEITGFIDHDAGNVPDPMPEPPPAVIPEELYDPGKQTLFLIEKNAEFISLVFRIMGGYFNIYYTADGIKAIEKMKIIPKPDIILVDADIKDTGCNNFIDMCTQTEKLADVPILFFTEQKELEAEIEGFRKGVIDFVSKPVSLEVLLEKIRAVLKNREIMRNNEIKKMEIRIGQLLREEGDSEFISFEKKCTEYRITPREKAVIRELFKGLETKEIGEKLFLSINTVRKHVRSIYEKCKVQNRVELVNRFK